MAGDDAQDVLVVREGIDGCGVIAADVARLPTAGNLDTAKGGDARDQVAINTPDASRLQHGDEGSEDGVAIERVAAPEPRIASAAKDEIAAVLPQLGRKPEAEADAVRG